MKSERIPEDEPAGAAGDDSPGDAPGSQPEESTERAPRSAHNQEIDDILREALTRVPWATPSFEGNDTGARRGPARSPERTPASAPSSLRGPAEKPRVDVRFESDERGIRVVDVGATDHPRIKLSPGLAVAVGLGLLVGFLWYRILVGMGTPAVPVRDPVYAEASTRWVLALNAARIDDFIRDYHRTPNSLTEVGHQAWGGISYDRVDESRYALTAAGPQSPIVYDSMQPRDSFLGNSVSFLSSTPGARQP